MRTNHNAKRGRNIKGRRNRTTNVNQQIENSLGNCPDNAEISIQPKHGNYHNDQSIGAHDQSVGPHNNKGDKAKPEKK
jgi:hypothetical protein